MRQETARLRDDVRELSARVGGLQQEIINLRAELTHLKEDRENVETEEPEPRWKM